MNTLNGNSLTPGRAYILDSGDAGDDGFVGDIFVAGKQGANCPFATSLVNITQGPRLGRMVEALLVSDVYFIDVGIPMVFSP